MRRAPNATSLSGTMNVSLPIDLLTWIGEQSAIADVTRSNFIRIALERARAEIGPEKTDSVTTAPMVETTFTVGRHFTVAMSLPLPTPGGGLDAVLDVRWSPRMPGRRPNKKELADYRRGRDAALSEVARWIGKRVIVIER